jgi:alkylated DNA repair dioxygenase AlkB
MLRILQPYYRDLVAQGHLPLGDGQSDRYAAHNEKWARWLHLELERSLRPVAPGHKASYSYLGSYVAGAILARHTDREQCGLTASVCIDEEGPDPDFHWPLGLEDRAGQDVKATLLPGDALLFRGTELPHYREQLPSGCSYTSIFFHFVHNEFQGSLD